MTSTSFSSSPLYLCENIAKLINFLFWRMKQFLFRMDISNTSFDTYKYKNFKTSLLFTTRSLFDRFPSRCIGLYLYILYIMCHFLLLINLNEFYRYDCWVSERESVRYFFKGVHRTNISKWFMNYTFVLKRIIKKFY